MNLAVLPSCIRFGLFCDCFREQWLMLPETMITNCFSNTKHSISVQTGEGGGGVDSLPTPAIPWVFYLPCETTNLSESGLPPILLPRTNGEDRGSHSRGALPQVLPHFPQKSQRDRVKSSNHCPLFTTPPSNPLWTQALVWLLKHFEAKVKVCQYRADRSTIRPVWLINIHLLQDAANSTVEL